MRFSIFAMAAMAVAVTASPVDSGVPSKTASSPAETDIAEIRSHLPLGTAHGGALDLPKPTAPPQVNNKAANGGPDYWTISLLALHGQADVSTVHVEGWGSPTPRGGKIPAGNIPKYNWVGFEIPKGYNGNVAFNQAGYSLITGDESQVEFSYIDQYNNGNYIFDINISYVNGFTLPAVCVCGAFGAGGYNHLTGCGKDLWKMNSCPDNNGQGACRNPQRPKRGDVGPTQFFAPCHYPGGGYTYPDDNLANNMNGDCTSGLVTCCLGNECGAFDQHGPS